MLAHERSIQIGNIVFKVRTPWIVMRRYIDEMVQIEAAQIGEFERQRRAEDATRGLLRQVVVGWEGIHDEDGRPIPYSSERLDEVDVATVGALLEKLAEPPEELGIKKGPSGWR